MNHGDYFRIRDFEYAQPLYDLAFLLDVDAISKGTKKPKYRTFALWKAAISLDSYSVKVDQWLDKAITEDDLDQVPSTRIASYLKMIRVTGQIPELQEFLAQEQFQRCLRLRSLRGLGPNQIAKTLCRDGANETWFEEAARSTGKTIDEVARCFAGEAFGTWQAAHVLPPLSRLLSAIEDGIGASLSFKIHGLTDVFSPVSTQPRVSCSAPDASRFRRVCKKEGEREVMFQPIKQRGKVVFRHIMGWSVELEPFPQVEGATTVHTLLETDPLWKKPTGRVRSDLHFHSTWSDGAASLDGMSGTAASLGMTHVAVTDHSRSSKLQRGLTPVEWLRQSNSLTQ